MGDVRLISNVHDQLDRLVLQLAEIEGERESLSPEEYDEMKEETIEQLKELSAMLEKMESGDVSVVDTLSATKMAIRSAISNAFRTPEIVSLFARKQPALLRQKLIQLDTDYKLKKVEKEVYESRKVEILSALYRLNDQLSIEEKEFLQNVSGPTFDLLDAPTSGVCKDNIVSGM